MKNQLYGESKQKHAERKAHSFAHKHDNDDQRHFYCFIVFGKKRTFKTSLLSKSLCHARHEIADLYPNCIIGLGQNAGQIGVRGERWRKDKEKEEGIIIWINDSSLTPAPQKQL